MSIKTRIISKSADLGFAATGIAAIDDTQSFKRYLLWIHNGFHATMDYLERHASLRQNPSELLPEARSIIAVAVPYPVNPSPGKGFSTYARGKDYHIVLRERLAALAVYLREDCGATATRICVDSAPVLEREWAVRAGLGWIGKQNQVINLDLGCCFFVGLLLTDLELEPSAQIENQCGACRKCLDACPTGAIDEEGFLHARKCISYLTIEHDAEIPSTTGRALFGCDLCTSVCPHNPQDSSDVLPEFKERDCPDEDACLAMSDPDFETRFAETAVHRTGLARLQRNARAALQDSPDK